ncbi:MAG: aminotransferase class V-fold PLP-dependent enzyme, partial [Raoultibacter sp.]
MTQIYLDNAATTQMRPEALDAMLPHLTEAYGNASSIYPLGEEAAVALSEARATIAHSLNATDREIYFTSGGSESDNWALIATAEAYENKGRHIITSAIEHHAVLHTAEYLEKRGFEVTYLPVD